MGFLLTKHCFFLQLFRASANLLELINYSLTFYIYCLFSEDFRNTLFRTIRWPWFEKPLYNRGTEVRTPIASAKASNFNLMPLFHPNSSP